MDTLLITITDGGNWVRGQEQDTAATFTQRLQYKPAKMPYL